MRHDVAVFDMGGQGDVDRHRAVSVAANAVAGDGQGADVAQTTLGDLSDSGGKDFVTVQVEELDGAGDVDGETATTECPAFKNGGKSGRHGQDTVAAFEVGGSSALSYQ